MNTKQRVSAQRGRASCRFGCQRVGCDRISSPRNPQGRKIATNNFGIREMSVQMTNASTIFQAGGSYIWRILGLMKSLFALAFTVALAPMLASGQTVQTYTIDPLPSGTPLEKTVGFFTSTTMPSVVMGMDSSGGGVGGRAIADFW
jgi:hypothetical protein